ncbi:unnamed protein product [Colias eurytheme]|nr:unnamed protein product [Colias eurytheme]
MWQGENMHLDVAIQHLDAFTNWLDNYRENGFQASLVTAREIAEENDIDRQFKEVRRRRKKRHFDYEGEDEGHELNAEEIFKINYFYVIVDNVRASCHPRFKALKHHESIFGFMYNVKRLKEISDSELLKQCSDLQISMTVGESCDIDEHELYEELTLAILSIENDVAHSLDYCALIKDFSLKKSRKHQFYT